MFKQFFKKLSWVLPAVLVAVGSTSVQAADPTSVEGIVSSAGSLFDSIKPITIGVVAFGILIGLVKLVRRK